MKPRCHQLLNHTKMLATISPGSLTRCCVWEQLSLASLSEKAASNFFVKGASLCLQLRSLTCPLELVMTVEVKVMVKELVCQHLGTCKRGHYDTLGGEHDQVE